MKIPYFFTIIIFNVFIFSACHEDELYPAANFTGAGYVPGFKWKLDASGSVSPDGQTLLYRWDADADFSEFDTPWSESPVYTPIGYAPELPFNFVTLQVKDENGSVTEFTKQVFRNSFIYYFWHDTLRINQTKTPFNRYRHFKESKSYGGDWMVENVKITGSANTTNMADSVSNGSYISWNEAKSLQLANTYFNIPLKDDWKVLIDHFNGIDLAGYNLQVKNEYGMDLGLFGYAANNQLYENGIRGYYWTGTEVDESNALALEISETTDSVRFVSLPKFYQCKVRLAHPNLY